MGDIQDKIIEILSVEIEKTKEANDFGLNKEVSSRLGYINKITEKFIMIEDLNKQIKNNINVELNQQKLKEILKTLEV